MAILFISNVVPDIPKFNGSGFSRSGNNVLVGICENLPKNDVTILSCRPIRSFPHSKFWINGEIVPLNSEKDIILLPTLNLKVVKNIAWGFSINKFIKKWAKLHQNEERIILVYNIYTPPISKLYKICKRNSCKLYAILYDLGVPPKSLKLSSITQMGYRWMERVAKKYIPLLDGRIIINEAIINKYSPGKDYLLIDGGLSKSTINNLFPLYKKNEDEKYNFTLAGLLWDQNGTKLVLDCLRLYPDLDINVNFAGRGIDVPLIISASKNDKRIKYLGNLSQKELFKLYAKTDILLNLRIEDHEDTHFPSKLLEYLSTGKHILSTPIAHAEKIYGEFVTFLHDPTPDNLAIVIKKILNMDPDVLFNKGKKARAFMLEQRNWQIQTLRIINYINGNYIENKEINV